MLCAVWCALGIIFFIKTARLILDNTSLPVKLTKKQIKKKKKSKEIDSAEKEQNAVFSEPVKTVSSIISGLILAFSTTYWFQSTSVEVYSLHIFLLTLIIYFSVKVYLIPGSAENKKRSTTLWLITAFVTALGFTNHMTTLLILPGLAYLFFSREKFNKDSLRLILKMILVFLPVLIILYSYMPIRAAQNPLINWGNPVDFERFWRHFTGKQYQVWLFSSFDSAKAQFTYFVNNLPNEFTVIGLGFAFIGLFVTYKFARKIFYFSLITFSATVLYSINYDIVDIDSYFLLAYIAAAFWAAAGTAFLIRWLAGKGIEFKFSVSFIILLAAIHIYTNFSKVDQSDVMTFEDYSKSVLNSTEKNSIIFSYLWDYFVSESYYFQNVENYRRDVTVVDKELLRRSWYYNQLENNSPGIFKGFEDDIESFLKALQPFERGGKYNANLLEGLYRSIMTNLVEKNVEERDFYISPELFENEIRRGEFKLPEGYTLVPQLFLYKVVKGNEYVPAPDPELHIRSSRQSNKYLNYIYNVLPTMLANRAVYELQFNKMDRAKLYIQKIASKFPGYQIPAKLREFL